MSKIRYGEYDNYDYSNYFQDGLKDAPFNFGEEMPDGRLTADYDTTTITHFRELVKKRTELGRPLTEEEMKEYEIEN